VVAAWLLVAVVQGVQATFGASLQGQTLSFSQALRASLVQAVPWIPVTLAVIAMAVRFPLGQASWRRRIWLHLLAALVVAYVATVLMVIGFSLLGGSWGGWGALGRDAARWTAIRLHVSLVTYAVIAAVTQALMARRAARERELALARAEGQLARARLQALTAQIRPHFLFNTLHTIGQLWRAGRSEAADALLDHLGALFHRVQDTTSRAEIPLAEELEMVGDYLAIEEVRFRDRMRVVVEAAPDALECAVPPLILQPIVENALRHGISASSSASVVEVHASVAAGRLHLHVRDDGPGMSAPPARPGSGTGLRNTWERLAQLYGKRASLVIDSAPGGGTTVHIELPARREAATERPAEAEMEIAGG
jgi:signal transduction histidine kinase